MKDKFVKESAGASEDVMFERWQRVAGLIKG
jgi:hypothetical protein